MKKFLQKLSQFGHAPSKSFANTKKLQRMLVLWSTKLSVCLRHKLLTCIGYPSSG